jgi:hypothetical protein
MGAVIPRRRGDANGAESASGAPDELAGSPAAADSPPRPVQQLGPAYPITSHPTVGLPGIQLRQAGRDCWGMESGLHQRLDVSAGEAGSQERHRASALTLAMLRRR